MNIDKTIVIPPAVVDMKLRVDEAKIVQFMRKSGKFVTFHVDKKPSQEHPDGQLVRIIAESSQLVSEINIDQGVAKI